MLGLLADPDGNRVAILRSLTLLRQLACTRPWSTTPTPPSRVGQGRDASSRCSSSSPGGSPRAGLQPVRPSSASSGNGSPGGYADLLSRRPDPRPEARIREFRDGTAPAFLISLKAGGSGPTLTEADHVFVMDPWWNPAAEAQAVDRAHRIGQDKHVMVYRPRVGRDDRGEGRRAPGTQARPLRRVVDGGSIGSGCSRLQILQPCSTSRMSPAAPGGVSGCVT